MLNWDYSMKKEFVLRVDIESDKGLREGIPKLLDLLKKYNIKASFYLVMGGESTLFDLLRYRGKMKSSMERTIRVWSLADKIRMALFPRDFVKINLPVLRRILNEGHELGIHGWKHRAWTRGLDKINIAQHLKFAIDRYSNLFGRRPLSFCAPGFNTNQEVLRVLEKESIKVISDFPDRGVKRYGKLLNVPVNVHGPKNTPIIEYLVSKGLTDAQIYEQIISQIRQNKLSVMYIHDLFEAIEKRVILENIFKYLKANKIKSKKITEIKK